MRMEGEEEVTRLEEEFKAQVFIADMGHGLEIYKQMFPTDERDTFTDEDIKEVLPQNEDEFRTAANEMLRMGLISGVAQ